MRPTRIARPHRRRAGFTLVEVIVVLVILAILAAIAIPALTGYIAKAQDKQYIAEARNHMVAIRTVLNEAYANGEITSHVFDNGNALHEFEVGSNMGTNATRFEIGLISYFATEEDYDTYARRAAALIGEAFPADSTAALEERTWHYSAVAQRGVGATAATADGFVFSLSPEGADIGLPEIVVTYKINAINEPTRIGDIVNPSSNVSYDPNAGYEVYHFMPQ